MSQPTQEKLPPAYQVHRGLLVAVVVLAAALVFAYLLGPVIVDVIQWVLSRIQAVGAADMAGLL